MKSGKLMATLMTISLAADMTGCGRAETAQTNETQHFKPALDTAAELTLNVVGSMGNFEALDRIAVDFNEYYPNISIVYSNLEDFDNALENRLATGQDVDLFASDGWISESHYDNAENLLDAGIDMSAVVPDVLATGYYNGELKALPICEQVYGYMVNVSLLEANGLTVPASYDEFIAVCDAFKDKGIYPILAHPSWANGPFISHFAAEAACRDDRETVIADLNAGNDSCGVLQDTLAMIDAFHEKDYYHPDSANLEDVYNAVLMRFLNGDIPFAAFSSGNYSGIRKREAQSDSFQKNPFAYTFIASPTGADGYEAYYARSGSLSLSVYKDSANLAYANEFLRFLAGQEELHTLAEVKGMPSTTENTGDARFQHLENLKDTEKIYAADTGLSLASERGFIALALFYVPGETSYEEALAFYRECVVSARGKNQ